MDNQTKLALLKSIEASTKVLLDDAQVATLNIKVADLGLKPNFTLHSDAINEFGKGNWRLVNVTGSANIIHEGGSFPISDLVFHFEDNGEPVKYKLQFNSTRLRPAPPETILEVFSPENKDGGDEQFLYYLEDK